MKKNKNKQKSEFFRKAWSLFDDLFKIENENKKEFMNYELLDEIEKYERAAVDELFRGEMYAYRPL